MNVAAFTVTFATHCECPEHMAGADKLPEAMLRAVEGIAERYGFSAAVTEPGVDE